jgi:hypothetical protein
MPMFNKAVTTLDAFLAPLSPERRETADAMIAFVRKNIPAGYEEGVALGFVTWSVPLSVLPDTYNKQALWYVAFAATKAGFSLYPMAVYGDPKNAAEFKAAFEKSGKKLKMGKACVNFTTMDDLHLPAVKGAIAKVPMKKYVEAYRAIRAKTKKGK